MIYILMEILKYKREIYKDKKKTEKKQYWCNIQQWFNRWNTIYNQLFLTGGQNHCIK